MYESLDQELLLKLISGTAENVGGWEWKVKREEVSTESTLTLPVRMHFFLQQIWMDEKQLIWNKMSNEEINYVNQADQ